MASIEVGEIRAPSWEKLGQYVGMAGDVRALTFDGLVADLNAIRKHSHSQIRRLELPALMEAARIVDMADDEMDGPAAISAVLRTALDTFGGGATQEAAEYLLGLYPGSQIWPEGRRQKEAAEILELSVETFRKKPRADMLAQIAEAILERCHDARLRSARVDMEQRRHPADSRLAVQWVERFEAYYRIWTPAYALAEDLEAAIDTYLEEPSEHPPWAPESDQPYDRDRQAQGYGHSALYRLTEFWLELRRFKSRHGGLWLLSDAQVEQDVADAVYRIGWHNDLSDGDESFLRRLLADSRHEEVEHFWNVLQGFPRGMEINRRWQEMIRQGVGLTTEEEKAKSQVWLTIAACRDYCRLIDEDWLRIADWYREAPQMTEPLSGASLYQAQLRGPWRAEP